MSRKRKKDSPYHRHLSTMVINTHGQLLSRENNNEGVLFKLPDDCKVCYIGNLNRSLYFQRNLIEKFKDLIYDGKGFLKSDFGKSSHDDSELTYDGKIYIELLEKVNNICLIKSLLSKHSDHDNIRIFEERYHTIICQESHESIDDTLYKSFLSDFKYMFSDLRFKSPNEFPEDLTIYIAKGERGESIKFPDFLLNFDNSPDNCRTLGCNFSIIDTNIKTLQNFERITTIGFHDIMTLINNIKQKMSDLKKQRRVPYRTPETSLRLSELVKTFSINNSKYNNIVGNTFKCKTFYVFCCKGFDGNIHKLSTYCNLSRAIQLQKHDNDSIVKERVRGLLTNMKSLEKILYSRSPMSSSEEQESRSYRPNYSSTKKI